MPITVLYAEGQLPDDALEREIFGANVTIVHRKVTAISELAAADCAEIDGLMVQRFAVSKADMARFPKLKCIVRMGVGYDRVDRAAAAERNILVCNVPDYGTTEVADHAITLALTLRRGIIHYHDTQRADPVAPWRPVTTGGLVRRLGVQTFGIVGLGRIGTAAALRAKALGFRVVFFDPHLPNGSELAIGAERARTLAGSPATDRHVVDPCTADAGNARFDWGQGDRAAETSMPCWSTRPADRSSISTASTST